MIEFLRKIKKDFLKKYLFSYFLYIVVTVLYMCFLIRDFSVSSLLISILVFILISGLFLFVGRAILVQFLNERLGSQEVISRSIFKNTRTVINNLSHEIRTPLNAIMGFAANLYEEEVDENKQKALLAIKANSERLFSTAKKIIDFSSIETGHFEINKEFISNHALLGNLVTKYKGEIDRKNLRLSIINTIPEHGLVYTDQNALFEILEMLLENAIKFTEKGSITIESSYHNGELEYTLEDSGSGISDQQKDIVFQLYRQGNSNMDREYEGVGLGLTIADKLTQMLEGSITLSDSESGGARFRIIMK
ncbi:MAG: HAMP domain-containing histidine kinase, partial [Spirochaetaceae bacterium]|nr:HAMP domain-containing histidine kinase [Spirochaetaceae bacterium]